LHYDKAPISEPPFQKLTYNNGWRPGKQFQKPFEDADPEEAQQKVDIPLLSLVSLDHDDITLTQHDPDVTIDFEIGFTAVTVDEGLQKGYRNMFLSSAFFKVSNGTTMSTTINDISTTFPAVPLTINSCPDTLCNDKIKPSKCIGSVYCECPHVRKLPFKRVVEIVIVSRGLPNDVFSVAHPFHLHGYHFRVLAQGIFEQLRADEVGTVELFKEMDRKGQIHRRRSHVPLVDTVPVPDDGYAVIRLFTDNPGFWILHCHMIPHLGLGMGVILHVAANEEVTSTTPPPPPQPQVKEVIYNEVEESSSEEEYRNKPVVPHRLPYRG